MITISNSGQLIKSTNFWQTNYAQKGEAFVTMKAGAIRLLLPPAMYKDIAEMATAKLVEITIDKARGASELLFDVQTAYPYVMFLPIEQWIDLPARCDYKKPYCLFSVWRARRGEPHKVLTRRCLLQRVKR